MQNATVITPNMEMLFNSFMVNIDNHNASKTLLSLMVKN